jgi:hypothetical protein
MSNENFAKLLDDDLDIIHEAFKGGYKEEIEGLLGLSKEEIDKITPDTTDLETYDKLIAVVRRASANNISQAELKNRIIELGEVAVSISKRVTKLAGLFI